MNLWVDLQKKDNMNILFMKILKSEQIHLAFHLLFEFTANFRNLPTAHRRKELFFSILFLLFPLLHHLLLLLRLFSSSSSFFSSSSSPPPPRNCQCSPLLVQRAFLRHLPKVMERPLLDLSPFLSSLRLHEQFKWMTKTYENRYIYLYLLL